VSIFDRKPAPLFQLLIHDVNRLPGFTGAVAGYEGKKWRDEAIADYLFEWLPEFALKYSELEDFNSATGMKLIKRAAKTVYTTGKYQKRGEFGELLLHALIREVFDSEPVISKIYYKSAINDTVKGFDAVHVVDAGSGLELWLGEVKFYKDLSEGIRDVARELQSHTVHEYLRDEFLLIDSKIDAQWRHAQKVKALISEKTSLDTVFSCTCIPVLLTYDSKCVNVHDVVSKEFEEQLTQELELAYCDFSQRQLPELRIHLFLVPLHNKGTLVATLQAKLEGLQR